MDDAPSRLSQLKEAYGWETVPMVLSCAPSGDKFFIGGYTDLVEAYEKSEQGANEQDK